MKVQVIGHNGKGRGSSIIKWATRGDYSHVSMRFQFESEEELRRCRELFNFRLSRTKGVYTGPLTLDHELESIQGVGVHHQPFVPSDNQGWFDFEHDSHQAVGILGTASKLVGCDYDWRGIGGFATRRNTQNSEKWFCSEYASHCLLHNRIVALKMPCHWQTPNVFLASPIFNKVRSPIT